MFDISTEAVTTEFPLAGALPKPLLPPRVVCAGLAFAWADDDLEIGGLLQITPWPDRWEDRPAFRPMICHPASRMEVSMITRMVNQVQLHYQTSELVRHLDPRMHVGHDDLITDGLRVRAHYDREVRLVKAWRARRPYDAPKIHLAGPKERVALCGTALNSSAEEFTGKWWGLTCQRCRRIDGGDREQILPTEL